MAMWNQRWSLASMMTQIWMPHPAAKLLNYAAFPPLAGTSRYAAADSFFTEVTPVIITDFRVWLEVLLLGDVKNRNRTLALSVTRWLGRTAFVLVTARSDTMAAPERASLDLDIKLPIAHLMLDPTCLRFLQTFGKPLGWEGVVLFWLDIDRLRAQPSHAQLLRLCEVVWNVYFQPNAELDIRRYVPKALRQAVAVRLREEDITPYLFDDIQDDLWCNAMQDLYQMFLKSSQYSQLIEHLVTTICAHATRGDQGMLLMKDTDCFQNPVGVQLLRSYLKTIKQAHLLDFCLSVITLQKRVTSPAQLMDDATTLIKQYIHPLGKHNLVTNPKMQKKIASRLVSPSSDMFEEAFVEVKELICAELIPQWLQSEHYAERFDKIERWMRTFLRPVEKVTIAASAEQMLALLVKGAFLRKHTSANAPEWVFVQCNRRGKLFYSRPQTAQPDHKKKRLYLRDVKDILTGRQTAGFQNADVDLDDDRCFSLITDKRDFDFQAVSPQIRDQWVSALLWYLRYLRENAIETDHDGSEDEKPVTASGTRPASAARASDMSSEASTASRTDRRPVMTTATATASPNLGEAKQPLRSALKSSANRLTGGSNSSAGYSVSVVPVASTGKRSDNADAASATTASPAQRSPRPMGSPMGRSDVSDGTESTSLRKSLSPAGRVLTRHYVRAIY